LGCLGGVPCAVCEGIDFVTRHGNDASFFPEGGFPPDVRATIKRHAQGAALFSGVAEELQLLYREVFWAKNGTYLELLVR
jgi:hypothetical protein